MSIAIPIDVKETGSKVFHAIGQALQPAKIGPIIGRSATNTIRTHLFGVNNSRPNKLGGRRTNYYGQAARSTQFQMQGDTVVVSINQIGIAQRYFGGTIKPKTAKFLAIPVHPAAHGKRPREFDLEVVFGEGGRPIALATKKTSDVRLRQTKRGKVTRSNVTRFGEIMFRLVKSVTQQPDPTVLPYDEQIEAGIDRDVGSYLDRTTQRAGGTTS